MTSDQTSTAEGTSPPDRTSPTDLTSPARQAEASSSSASSPANLLHDRAARVDAAVCAAFEDARPNVTVAAVGGYGRQELFPYSDVDLLLLVDRIPEAGAEKEQIAEFLRLLWDQGLRASQSVRPVADCCELHEGNLELTISLLDQRYVCGPRERFVELERRFPKFLAAQKSAIARELCKAARARHARYQDTIYHLEPNVKEHPGGLRDAHVVHWLSKIGGAAPEEIGPARDFISTVRLHLHDRFRRDANALTFEVQETISQNPSQWMRGYYRNAREIFRVVKRALDTAESANAGLLAQFRDWRSRLSNADFTVSRDRVYLRDPHRLDTDPGLLMRFVMFISRHQLSVAADTERRLIAATPAAPSWPQLREFLSLPQCSPGLQLMHDTGALQAIIPEWQRIDSLVVRDFYHRYTVDEHTLLTIRVIENLAAEKEGLRARFADLATEIDRPDLLRLALLLHDIGKGEGDHVAKSIEIATTVLARLGVPPNDAATVLFLIRHHLDLSSVMVTRDLADPATARHVASEVGAVERLKLLALMTYADISSVNPAAMTPWRLEQLWRTYIIAYEELTRELDAERIHADCISAREEPDAARAEFLEGFPTRYLRTHSDAEIDRHMEQAASGTMVDLARTNGTYSMTVIAPDRPFLLASISGALASFGFNILKAEAFANKRGLVLDTFVFADPMRTLELNPGETDRVSDTVTRCVLGKTDVKQLLKRRPRQPTGGRVKPAVTFNNDVSAAATLIEIVAEDRPGLLYDLTSAASGAGCNIEVVLIDTEAHKALDVFYVTCGGAKLPPEVESMLRASLLAACSPVLK